MLKSHFDKAQEVLNIHFDVPIPPSIETHQELQRVITTFTKTARVNFFRADDRLTGLSVQMNDWYRFIEQNFSPDVCRFQRSIFEQLARQESSAQGDGLQVNFHQQSFDSPERYWNFILNQGHFLEYFLNRMNWYLGPKNAIVTPFPLHVDLESASTCNMNCPMCYRNMLQETGQMKIELFQKVVDECAANNVFSIRLSWRGETLTHPRIKEMIAYATSKIKNVSFLTNAFYLDEAMVECFIENKVSYVAISFDGIGNIYETIRHPAKFEENYNRLARLRDRKREAHSLLPQIRLCTIWPAIKENPDEYYNTMKEVSDYIVCNPYINFKGPMKLKPDFICQYPWERIVIGFNGDTQCCTGWNASDIILGNVRERSIYEMWHSDVMNEIRTIHAEGRRLDLKSCANCRHGSQGEPDVNISDIVERRF